MRPLARHMTIARWIFLLAILIGELLVLTVRFDTAELTRSGGTAARWLGHAEYLPEIGLAFAAALLVVGAGRLREIAQSLLAQSTSYRHWWLPFGGQIAAFAALYGVTWRLFEAPREALPLPALWPAVWLALVATTLALWFAAVAPPATWLRLARAEWPALLAGGGVGLAAWGAGRLTQKLWRPLSDGTFYVVLKVLRLMVSEDQIIAYPEDKKLGVGRFIVTIAPDCSGYEGIGLISVFLAAFLWIFRRSLRFPQAFLLWPIGIGCIWLANSLRIALLILLGARWSRDVAIGGFHSQAGWLAFLCISLALVAAALRIPFFSLLKSSESAGPTSRTPAYLLPLLVLLAARMILRAFQADDFDKLYPLKVLITAAVLCWYARVRRPPAWSWSWYAVGAGIVVFAFWMGMAFYPAGQDHSSSLPDNLAAMNRATAVMWIVFRVIGSVVTVPLAEELAFRGYLMRRIGSADFEEQAYARCSWFAVIISSALFGFLHARWVAGALAGLVYALVARRRGKLADAVLAHAVTNALIAATVLTGGAWWLWS